MRRVLLVKKAVKLIMGRGGGSIKDVFRTESSCGGGSSV